MNHLGDTNKMVGEDHIRDATKMVSDTPRTDAAEKHAYEFKDEYTPVCESKLVRQLERELNAANDRIKRLEEAGDAMASILNNTRKDWYTSDQCEVTAFTWNEAKEAKP